MTTDYYHNIKALYHYELEIDLTQVFGVYNSKNIEIILVILFNDFSIQSYGYENKEEMLSCIEIKHRDILYEVKSKTLINLLTSKSKIQRELSYNLYKSI